MAENLNDLIASLESAPTKRKPEAETAGEREAEEEDGDGTTPETETDPEGPASEPGAADELAALLAGTTAGADQTDPELEELEEEPPKVPPPRAAPAPPPPPPSHTAEIPMARPQGGGPPRYTLKVSPIGTHERTAVTGSTLDPPLEIQVVNDGDGRAVEGVAVRFETIPDGACAFGDAGDRYAIVSTDATGVAKTTPVVKGVGSITVLVTINGLPTSPFVITAAAGAAAVPPTAVTAPNATLVPANPYRIQVNSPTAAVPAPTNPSTNPYRIRN